jgi:hypothetical protein
VHPDEQPIKQPIKQPEEVPEEEVEIEDEVGSGDCVLDYSIMQLTSMLKLVGLVALSISLWELWHSRLPRRMIHTLFNQVQRNQSQSILSYISTTIIAYFI